MNEMMLEQTETTGLAVPILGAAADEATAADGGVARIVAEMKAENRRLRKRYYLAIGACMFWSVVMANLTVRGYVHISIANAVCGHLIGPILIATALALPSRRLSDLTQALCRSTDPSAVLALIAARSEILPPRVQRSIRQALLERLPLLKASDAHLLRPGHYRWLHSVLDMMRSLHPDAHILRRFGDTEMGTAVLRALEQVGTEESVRYVRAVTKARTKREEDKPVKALAVEVLASLEARLNQERPSQTLLRPALSPPDSSLLLPSGALPSRPEFLVRPVEAADSVVLCVGRNASERNNEVLLRPDSTSNTT